MSSLFLDTNAYSEFTRGRADAVRLLNAATQVWVPAIVLGELRYGFANGSQTETNEIWLSQFLESPHVSVVSISEATSRYYALICRQLRVDGKPIPTNDIWIAASAIEHDCPLFTFDAHMRKVKALKVVSDEADWIALNS